MIILLAEQTKKISTNKLRSHPGRFFGCDRLVMQGFVFDLFFCCFYAIMLLKKALNGRIKMNILPDLFLTFAKIGTFTFGGGYAMISLIDRECVEKKKWITSDELMEITVIAESTPGPIAINLATYAGYKKAGVIGAAAATLGIILPSFLIILLISTLMEDLLSIETVAKCFKGIRIAVTVLIIQAAVKMIKGFLKKSLHKYISSVILSLFFSAVIVINLFQVSFSTIYLILIAGIFGFVVYGIILKEKNK